MKVLIIGGTGLISTAKRITRRVKNGSFIDPKTPLAAPFHPVYTSRRSPPPALQDTRFCAGAEPSVPYLPMPVRSYAPALF